MPKEKTPFLSNQLKEIESHINHRDQLNPEVSQVNVAWHLDHMLKVINGIYKALDQSDSELYKTDINVKRSVLFTLGRIPRGRGKSPKSVFPPEKIISEHIYTQLDQSKINLLALDSLDKNKYFKHAVFGTLNNDKAKKFIKIHTNHHLRIVRDILSKAQ